jgi:hypothetical protein
MTTDRTIAMDDNPESNPTLTVTRPVTGIRRANGNQIAESKSIKTIAAAKLWIE